MSSGRLKGLLIKHEGLKLKPYYDTVGKLTIGVGRNLDDVGISEHEAMVMLENDIGIAESKADQVFPWFRKLNPARKDVIISMIFNLGLSGFINFKKMIKSLEQLDYNQASIEMIDSLWAKQVGNRAVELSNMMKTGFY
jgi:lysozyme